MSLLTLEAARAAGLGGSLGDVALQAAIDQEEAWLARRIGPLTGERTEFFPYPYSRPTSNQIRLRRPTDDTFEATETDLNAVVVDVRAFLEVRHLGWRLGWLTRGDHLSVSEGALDVTYTPTDELEVIRALQQLLGLTLSSVAAGGYQSEIMGSYSYTRAAGASTKLRKSILRDLGEPAEAGSTRLTSSIRHGLLGVLER